MWPWLVSSAWSRIGENMTTETALMMLKMLKLHQQKDFCIYNPGIAQVDLHRYFGFRGPFSWIILLYS